MDANELEYCERRAREERQCAEGAVCEEARLAHLRLAEAYEERLITRIVQPRPAAR
jgi:hypothetical protein